VHTWAIRGIVVLALTLSGLGAVVLAWPGHVSAGHAQLTTKQHVHAPARPGGLHVRVTTVKPKPFMY
jgi:hypothetical protein